MGLSLSIDKILDKTVGKWLGWDDDPYKDWLRQQNYNSPVEQMKRLQEAGLNPNLIYANGVANTATSAIRSDDGGLGLSVGFNDKSPLLDLQKILLENKLDQTDEQTKSLELDNKRKELQNDILQKTVDYYTKTGVVPGMHPMERLGLSLYDRVLSYDNETGNLSQGAFQLATFLNNLFGYFKDPRSGWYQPVSVKHNK